MMTAVMQPYLFPYPGYYQLAAAADRFVFYDDVQFIKGGYINRNSLRHGPFTVPLAGASSTDFIHQRLVKRPAYDHFCRKWFRGFELNYGNAPYYDAAATIARDVLTMDTDQIANLASASIIRTVEYLGLDVSFSFASGYEYDRSTGGEERLLSLLRQIGCRDYLNPNGGRKLYCGKTFREAGIDLSFLQSTPPAGPISTDFRYSILHLIATRPRHEVKDILMSHHQITSAN